MCGITSRHDNRSVHARPDGIPRNGRGHGGSTLLWESEHAWKASVLDLPDRHEVGAAEIYGHSLGGVTGHREPGRGLSRVPTDYECILPMLFSWLAVNAEKSVTEILSLPTLMTTGPETDSA